MQRILFLLIVITTSCSSAHDMPDSMHKELFKKDYNEFIRILTDVIKENEISAEIAKKYLIGKVGKPRYSKNIYFKDQSGVLADHNHKAKSNIYIPANVPITKNTWSIIQATEGLEDRWEDVSRKYYGLGWQYITDQRTMVSRTYPWLDEVRNLGPYIDFTKVPQWKIVTVENNPKRTSACTKLYFDHDGLGDVVSCVSPVDENGQMIANMSIDIPISSFFNKIKKELNESENACTFAFDSHRNIVVGTSISVNMPVCAYINEVGKYKYGDDNKPAMVNNINSCNSNNEGMLEYENNMYKYTCSKIPYLNGVFVRIYPM